jgi:hypothetical protein
MTLTIDLPQEAEALLEEESRRTGISIPELAGRVLMEHLHLTNDRIGRLIADISVPIDLLDVSREAIYAE